MPRRLRRRLVAWAVIPAIPVLLAGWAGAAGAAPASPTADLKVTGTKSPEPVHVDQPLVETVKVQNNGPDAASGVAVTDTLPVGVRFLSVTPSQGSCRRTAATVVCRLGKLANGAGATVTIRVVPTAEGSVTNTVEVVAQTADPNPADNRASAPTTVLAGSADLVAGLIAPSTARLGQPVIYVVSGKNRGPSTAQNVRVSIRFPVGTLVALPAGCSSQADTAGASSPVRPAPSPTGVRGASRSRSRSPPRASTTSAPAPTPTLPTLTLPTTWWSCERRLRDRVPTWWPHSPGQAWPPFASPSPTRSGAPTTVQTQW